MLSVWFEVLLMEKEPENKFISPWMEQFLHAMVKPAGLLSLISIAKQATSER